MLPLACASRKTQTWKAPAVENGHPGESHRAGGIALSCDQRSSHACIGPCFCERIRIGRRSVRNLRRRSMSFLEICLQ